MLLLVRRLLHGKEVGHCRFFARFDFGGTDQEVNGFAVKNFFFQIRFERGVAVNLFDFLGCFSGCLGDFFVAGIEITFFGFQIFGFDNSFENQFVFQIFDSRIPALSLKQFMLLSVARQAGEPMTFTQLGALLGCSRQNIKQLAEALEKGTLKHRLEVAKAEIRRFIMQRPNDRIGLIGFADQAYSFAPPTLDHAWLVDRLDQLEPGMIGDATGIAAPIGSATSRLKNSAAPRRVLVLFTDGANTAENRVTPEQAARLAKEFNVIIHTVGIGSNQAFVIGTGFGGGLVPVRDSFDEPLLRRLAETTGGSYFRAADADGMRQVMDEINRLERTNIEQPRYVEYREYAPLLALAALAVLLAGFTLQCTWKLRLP